jgi:hypothetical protein
VVMNPKNTSLFRIMTRCRLIDFREETVEN